MAWIWVLEQYQRGHNEESSTSGRVDTSQVKDVQGVNMLVTIQIPQKPSYFVHIPRNPTTFMQFERLIG